MNSSMAFVKGWRVTALAAAAVSVSVLGACGVSGQDATPAPTVTVTVTEPAAPPAEPAAPEQTPAAPNSPEPTPTATETPTASPTATPGGNGAITREQAIEIAIEAAGGGNAVDVDFYPAGGVGRWEILVRDDNGGGTEVYVNGTTGELIKVEVTDW